MVFCTKFEVKFWVLIGLPCRVVNTMAAMRIP